MFLASVAKADDNAFFKLGPLSLNIPFKSVRIAYGHDFAKTQEMIFGETPILNVWGKIEGTGGVVTSLQGKGSPVVGGDIILGNVLEKWVTLPSDVNFGGFGGRDFNEGSWLYGVKASKKLW